MKKEAELRVLRHFANDEEELVPKGMEKFECIAALDRLYEKKYVRVAWLTGHDFEGVSIEAAGLVYLKELEMEERGEQGELEQLRKENAELRAKLEQANIQNTPPNFLKLLDKVPMPKRKHYPRQMKLVSKIINLAQIIDLAWRDKWFVSVDGSELTIEDVNYWFGAILGYDFDSQSGALSDLYSSNTRRWEKTSNILNDLAKNEKHRRDTSNYSAPYSA